MNGTKWDFLWLSFRRIGYVETMELFGFTVYRRCGNIVEVFGYSWRVKQ
jgi:hypothetical protein